MRTPAIISLLVLAPVVAAAGGYDEAPQVKEKDELQEMLNVVKTTEVTDALDLSEENEAIFVDLYAELEKVRWNNHLRQMMLLQELRKELADSNKVGITSILDQIENEGAETYIEEVKLRTRIRTIIGETEYAKLMLFETNFNRKIRDMLLETNAAPGTTTEAYK